MKCNYCTKKATHICDAYFESGKVELRGCKKHWPQAYAQQQHLLMLLTREVETERARTVEFNRRLLEDLIRNA